MPQLRLTRCASAAFVGVVCGLALPVAAASAADPVVVNQSARAVSALGGDLVYLRKPQGKYVCMRRVAGKVSRASGLPPIDGCSRRMAVDSKGRVVVVFPRYRTHGNTVLSARWYVYDVKSDRARPLTGLPGGMCPTDPVVIWGKRMAYAVSCASKTRNGLWVKDGKRTQRILASATDLGRLVLRGDTLAGSLDVGPGDGPFRIYQLMVGGKRCVRAIEGSEGNSETEDLAGVWIAGGNIVWSTGYFRGDGPGPSSGFPGRALLTSRVPSHCAAPGPNGRFEFDPEAPYLTEFTVDGRQVYYAGYDGIRRHTLPAQPSYAPPPNDNFENAQSFAVGTSVVAPSGTAWATTQPGEPLTNAKQTIWYTFTPATSGTLYASVSTSFRSLSGMPFGVYTGSGLATLTPVAGPSPGTSPPLQFDAVAGRQYWIDVGTSDAQANFQGLSVRVGTTPY
ncbi:MAG TPA: hypothetical protein VGC98_01840 [Thermoleophilaceae bacterium]